MQVEESAIQFTFPSDWVVIKYDQHKFFRYLSGDGLKGVDFIGIDDSDDLFLMEVKHYRNVNLADGIHPAREVIKNPDAVVEECIGKLNDSLRLIEVIQKYHLRKWWFRLLAKWIQEIFPVLSRRRDWGFWRMAFLKKDLKIKYWLYLELSSDIPRDEVDKFHEEVLGKMRANCEHAQCEIRIMSLGSEQGFVSRRKG